MNIDRAKIARYGLNVADINGLIEAAVGGAAATQVVQGEKQFDLVVRLEQQFRDNPEAIRNLLVAAPDGSQIPLKELADIRVQNGASFIYREDNSRYIGVQFSVTGRDLAGAVDDARRQVQAQVPLPEGYRLDWGGEYKNYTAARRQLNLVLPLTLWLTHTPFSVSSAIGFLALFGVSVQTAVVYISYVNELRGDGMEFHQAVRDGAILRLRPIMMTALVAALGLLPAAIATGVGTDSQRPFALVIVSGLFTRLLISVFLMPALYVLVARPTDRLEV